MTPYVVRPGSGAARAIEYLQSVGSVAQLRVFLAP